MLIVYCILLMGKVRGEGVKPECGDSNTWCGVAAAGIVAVALLSVAGLIGTTAVVVAL